jgi:hypothetical protein
MFHFFINYFTGGDFAHDLSIAIRRESLRFNPKWIIIE